jgi:hypothetical protein
MNRDKLKARVKELIEDPTTREVLKRINVSLEVGDFRAQTREEKIKELSVELKSDSHELDLHEWSKFIGVKESKVRENIKERVKTKELERAKDSENRLLGIKELELARRARRRSGKV